MAAEPHSSRNDPNIDAYTQQRAKLEIEHPGEFVAIADGRIVGVYPSFDAAWKAAGQHRMKLVFKIGDEPVLTPLYISWGKTWHPDGH